MPRAEVRGRGLDYRNYTYAIFGGRSWAAGGRRVQVWDRRTTPWLRAEEYREEVVERICASSVEALAAKLVGKGLRDPGKFVETLREYNEAVRAHREENPDRTWDPAVKDGLSTQSSSRRLALAKSNWALPIDEAPFLAVKVTGGITFTFGGLAVDPETAAVISSTTAREIPGLYSVGEMLGGLFYGNYPGGSGLTSGVVFGRRAGRAAAKLVAGGGSGGQGAQWRARM
ncbi:precorrin 3B synthase CobZ [Teratosphaeria destructans]|uniref:Precorrin 3B synthase CobZ n=1 Tax=Teratosphaeria destructans TaxID=418781 RepID=A0A9W7W6Y9_9PEZI|nr:precorrin 3B synthase CobZ [Teratosphaeria destructans]